MKTAHETAPRRGKILTIQGRDAQVALSMMSIADIAADICSSVEELTGALETEPLFVVVSEESVGDADLVKIAQWVSRQPSWSDLPFVVLTHRGGTPGHGGEFQRLAELLGNVTFLERPFHAATFVSTIKGVVKARNRQFEARRLIDDLREGEQRLATALLAGRLGSWEYDIENSELFASPAFGAVFGRTSEEKLSYKTLLQIIYPDDRTRFQAELRRAVETGQDCVIEFRTVWPDRSVHWAEIRARMARGNGRPARLVGVSADITQRVESEERLRRLNETLEERVRERTAKLEAEIVHREAAEARLRQSQKLEAIGQLTGGVAHDFNNLLMAVLGNLELLRKNMARDPRAERLIDGAMQGARRGAALTQRLLAFARRQDLKTNAIDLKLLVEGMVDLIERSVGPMVEVNVSMPDGLPHALADANQVELALLNLAVNARDAMDNGGRLFIKLFEATPGNGVELQDGRYVVLSVSDTGHGMDEATLSKAVDPFFSTKKLGKGTGLGLSMVHGLAVQLNGGLFLRSTPRQGTTAEIWLPVADRSLQRQDADILDDAVAEARRSRILVVDDDFLVSMSAVDMLEDLGHEVIEANSGERALELLRNGAQPDLLITDFSMPRMNGAELAKAAVELVPGLQILVATGYADLPPGFEIDLPRISKPYTQAELAKEIAKLLI